MTVKGYFWNVFSGASHLLNALTGGSPMNSFSARVGAADYHGEAWAHPFAVVIGLLLGSPDHCRKHAIEEGLI